MSLRWMVTLSVFLIVCDFTDGQDVRLKLCGREFIRMVVTSCGSSRVRRSVLDFNHTHISSDNGLILDGSGQLANLVQNGGGDQRLEEGARGTENTPAEKHIEQSRAELDISQAVSVSRRMARDAGPAGVCCRSGCTMSELVQYC